MYLNEEAFNKQFTEALDKVMEEMAETPEIDPAKFFNMVCILENLQFFAPVLFSSLKLKAKNNDQDLETEL